MTDTQTNDRARMPVNGPSRDGRTTEHPLIAPRGDTADQALHVLAMAQRTAEEHVTGAQRHAETVRAEAATAAVQIAADADAHAQGIRREAEKALAEAHATKQQAARDAEAHLAQSHRNAQKVLTDARAEATSITARARADAEQLKTQAQHRHDDIVGSLGTKRAALQDQIEALEQFDREYRTRLLAFMQGQMRALWADQPRLTDDLANPNQADPNQANPNQKAPAAVIPAQRPPAQAQEAAPKN